MVRLSTDRFTIIDDELLIVEKNRSDFCRKKISLNTKQETMEDLEIYLNQKRN